MPNTHLNFDKYLFKQGGKSKKERWEMVEVVQREEIQIHITDNNIRNTCYIKENFTTQK